MVISSMYAHTHFPISPSRTDSMTLIAVAGAFASPCSITLQAKDPKGVLMVLYFSSAGSTLIWKYQLNRLIEDLNLALAIALRIVCWLGIPPWSFMVISFLGIRS